MVREKTNDRDNLIERKWNGQFSINQMLNDKIKII